MMSKVQIPKGLLAALVAVAGAAVLGMVFLLGRESGRSELMRHPQESGGTGVSALLPSASPALAAESVSQPAPEAPIVAPIPGAEGTGQAELPRPAGAGSSVVIPLGIAIPQGDSTRAAVAAYLQTVQNIQPEASGDPEAMAQRVVMGLGKGDTSGFDGMIQQAQTARSRLSAITPPQPCAAYHKESLASLDAGLDLMHTMKKALSSPESGTQLLDLADRANALKVRSEALQLQEKALKQRYSE
jgi:hypothetical protein